MSETTFRNHRATRRQSARRCDCLRDKFSPYNPKPFKLTRVGGCRTATVFGTVAFPGSD